MVLIVRSFIAIFSLQSRIPFRIMHRIVVFLWSSLIRKSSLGLLYLHDLEIFEEASYFVKCPSIWIFLKSQFYLFTYFWLSWVFVASSRPSLVALSGGHSSLQWTGFSLWWLLLSRSTGSSALASVVVAHGLSSCGSRALERRLSSCGSRA